MSHPLVSHSPDLAHLRDEGFNLEIRSNYLLVKHVPYVTSTRNVAYGTVISELSTSGSSTIKPSDHVVSFTGGIPCDQHGSPLTKIINNPGTIQVAEGLVADCTFSSKPLVGHYADYYAKITSYVNILSGPAQVIDPTATARTFPVMQVAGEDSVFRYLDSASSRARISSITGKLALPKVAIVGLGGTGSFILDLIVKTPIHEIHVYDRDILYAYNAFRAPGAASVDDLDAASTKVEYYQRMYEVMRRGIVPHPVHVDESNIDELRAMTFVFLAMDSGPAKMFIVTKLKAFGIPFIDAGMGVYRIGESLGGILRVATSTPEHRAHVWKHQRIPFGDEEDDEYDRNIQTADLNMLNAVLAVIKWKKLYGFYLDQEHEMFTTYTIGGNQLLNDDQAP
jgi:ThiF family